MSQLTWSEDLCVGVEFMDADHQAFLSMIDDCVQADDDTLPAAFTSLYEHTVEHFAREEALMKETGFFAFDCHKGEHERVLNEMRRFLNHIEKGNLAFARAYVDQQAPQWFILHRNTMDAATAAYANKFRAEQEMA